MTASRQRLGRRSAGRQVIALAAALSDDLLVAEEQCFALLDEALTAGAVLASQGMARTARKHRGDASRFAADVEMRRGLVAAQRQAMADGRGAVAALFDLTVAWSLDSIGDELAACEATLGARYRGLAVEAVEAARETTDGVVTAAMTGYADAEAAGLAAFERETLRQFQFGLSAGEDPEGIARRVLSVDVLRRPGIGGRGVWWRTGSGLHAAARAGSVGLSNSVRENAMAAFNAAHGRR